MYVRIIKFTYNSVILCHSQRCEIIKFLKNDCQMVFKNCLLVSG